GDVAAVRREGGIELRAGDPLLALVAPDAHRVLAVRFADPQLAPLDAPVVAREGQLAAVGRPDGGRLDIVAGHDPVERVGDATVNGQVEVVLAGAGDGDVQAVGRGEEDVGDAVDHAGHQPLALGHADGRGGQHRVVPVPEPGIAIESVDDGVGRGQDGGAAGALGQLEDQLLLAAVEVDPVDAAAAGEGDAPVAVPDRRAGGLVAAGDGARFRS